MESIESASKEVLVEMVKLTQKRGMKGSRGDWKEFLDSYDKHLGSTMSDPSRRTVAVLADFIKTFEKDEDAKFLSDVAACYSNRETALAVMKETSPDNDTPEKALVRLTVTHPQYTLEYAFPSYEEDWVIVKCSKKPKSLMSTNLLALDCEMVLCEDGTDALVKVCAVDRDLKVKIDEFVNPNKVIIDYRTNITGITAKDLEGVTTTLKDVQKPLKKLLAHGTILVGHSVNNDLNALKMDHARVIDTSYIFKFENAPYRKPSLSLCCKSLLGVDLREEGRPHDCLDDAIFSMKLALARLEGKIDSVITEEVKVSDSPRLLVHRIPANVSDEDLKSILSGDCTIEAKSAKIPGKTYSAFAIFNTNAEAINYYENLKGDLEKNTNGRTHKLVKFMLDSGISGSFCVCTPVSLGSVTPVSKKRSSEDYGAPGMCKKFITDKLWELSEESYQGVGHLGYQGVGHLGYQGVGHLGYQGVGHLGVIQRLQEEVSKRDEEISGMKKTIAYLASSLEALTRKI